MAKEENQGFTIVVSSVDRRVIDLTMASLLKTVEGTGASVKGPILQKNFVKDNVTFHSRRLVVIDPTEDTAAALGDLNLSQDVNIRIMK